MAVDEQAPPAESGRAEPVVLTDEPDAFAPDGDDGQLIRMVVLGPPGAGKTFFAGTAEDDPRTRPVLYFDFEESSMTIDYRTDGIQFVQVGPPNLNAVLRQLRTGVFDGTRIFKPKGREDSPYYGQPVRTVVIDSLTGLSDLVMADILATTTNSMRTDPDKSEGQDYNLFNARFRTFRSLFAGAKVHIIVVAREREYNNGIGPAMQGKQAPEEFAGAFNTVARLTVEAVPSPDGLSVQRERRLLFQPDGKALVKDRSDRLGVMSPTMKDPTVGKMLDRIIKGKRLAIAKRAKAAAQTAVE